MRALRSSAPAWLLCTAMFAWLCPGSSKGAGSEDVGTAAPTVLVAADPHERWAVICQARHDTNGDGELAVLAAEHGELIGDRMSTYLVVGAGAGEAISEFVSSSRDGSVVAYEQGGKLLLRDFRRGATTELDVELGTPAAEQPGRAFVTFSPDPTRVLYGHFSRAAARSSLTLRDLARCYEAQVSLPHGLLYRADLGPGAAWITAWIVHEDSDGNGRLEVPWALTNLPGGGCRARPLASTAFRQGGDTPHPFLVDVARGTVIPARDLVGLSGAGAYWRLPGGGVALLRPGGRSRPVRVTPDGGSCVPLAVSDDHEALLAFHETGAMAGGIVLHSLGKASVIARGVPIRAALEHPRVVRSDWIEVELESGASLLIDLRYGRVRQLAGVVVAQSGGFALELKDKNGAILHDLETGAVLPLPKSVGLTSTIWVAGRYALVDGELLIDLHRLRVCGSSEARGLALSSRGRVLVGRTGAGQVVAGPLRWTRPRDVR